MTTKVKQDRKCSLNQLSQFRNMRCEVTINTHTHNNKVMVTYVYEDFDYDNGEYILCLFDGNNETLNTKIDKSLITNINNLDSDVYNDVVSVYTNDFILSVTSLELRPIPFCCDKCGKEFEKYEEPWVIKQQASYPSVLDGEFLHIKICDNCLQQLFSSLLPQIIDEDGEWYE